MSPSTEKEYRKIYYAKWLAKHPDYHKEWSKNYRAKLRDAYEREEMGLEVDPVIKSALKTWEMSHRPVNCDICNKTMCFSSMSKHLNSKWHRLRVENIG